MVTTLSAVLLASLFGSLHCAGMCGPLIAFAVGTPQVQARGTRVLLQSAYHGGRLVAYGLVGAAFGIVGAAVDLGGALAGLHRVAAILAGSMMVGVGLISVLHQSGVRLPPLPAMAGIQRAVIVGQRAAMHLGPTSRATTIGLLSALLPCGWLYAFAIIAAGTASPVWGAAIMAAFWLGTVPVLASLGVGVQALTGTLGRRIPLVTAMVLVAFGLFTIADRMALPVQAFSRSVNTTDSALEQIESLGQSAPPCCQHHDP
jgi:sulfite exporter TauE/SafE